MTGGLQVSRPAVCVWQDPSTGFSPFRRVGDQIGDVLAARGAGRREAGALLERVGLAGRERAFPHELSGGQIQRAALARAVAVRPKVLVADEATGSLDPENERQIAALVNSLREEHGWAVLWITHRPLAVSALATEHWRIEAGELTPAAIPLEATPKAPAGEPSHGGEFVVLAGSLHKSYQAPVLRGVSIELQAGRTVTLRGASGSGKSTLARLLAGLESPDSGTVQRRGSVQLVWPDPATSINPGWRLADAIGEPLAVNGVRPDVRLRQSLEWMDRVSLPRAYANRRVRELSGGERRRATLARALITNPDCVIFDEATNGLDPELRHAIIELLQGLQRTSRAAYLWITHDEECAWAGDRLVLENGVLRNTRKTECGANFVPGQLVARAAPFALLRRDD